MSAVISECGLYRYRLERETHHPDREGRSVVAFIGVNPSTADATLDDATVRKWRGFATRWGHTHFVVGNLFAWRATDVGELARVADPKGPANDEHLAAMVADADLVVPCWGSRAKLPDRLRPRIDDVRALLRKCGRPVEVLGLTSSSDPRHPLMLGYCTPLQEWRP